MKQVLSTPTGDGTSSSDQHWSQAQSRTSARSRPAESQSASVRTASLRVSGSSHGGALERAGSCSLCSLLGGTRRRPCKFSQQRHTQRRARRRIIDIRRRRSGSADRLPTCRGEKCGGEERRVHARGRRGRGRGWHERGARHCTERWGSTTGRHARSARGKYALAT